MKRNTRIIFFSSDSSEEIADGLRQRGYDVLRYCDPAQTLAAVRRDKADIVLLDVIINEVHGAEIIREAKTKNPEVSVILMGSNEDMQNSPHMLMFAGYECISKPVTVDLLCAVIEQKLNQQHLYRVCSTMSITRDIHEILRMLLGLLADEIGADNGAVLLKDESSNKMCLKAVHGISDDLLGNFYLVDESDVLFLVMSNNEPIVLQGGFMQLPFLPSRLSRDISSSISAPIRIGGKTLGLLNVNRMKASAPFSQSNLRTVEIAALQTAVAIQNARAHQLALERHKLQQELNLAHSVQQSLLPKIPCDQQRFEIGVRSIPAYFVGGDFYDFVKLADDIFGIAIGDVAGKGVPGALMMVRTLNSFRLRARPDCEPANVLEQLNNDLLENSVRGMYATVLYAVFDFHRNTLFLANAGHPPPFLRRLNSVDTLDSSVGIPLGVLKNTTYRTNTFRIEESDIFISYTDGIIEARGSDQQEFSLSRLKDTIRKSPAGAGECANHILQEVGRFTAGLPQHDDLTLLTVRVALNEAIQRTDMATVRAAPLGAA